MAFFFYNYLFLSMIYFLKYLAASFLGCMIALFLIFLVMMGMFAGMASFGNKPVVVENNSVLLLELNTPIVERASDSPIPNINYLTLQSREVLGLNKILADIKRAKNDSKIKGIYLNLSTIQAGTATVEEIRNALIDFKESGKFIISYGDNYSQKSYYLATVADKIYLNPMGDLLLKGLSSQVMFYKKTLEKLDIDVQIIRHGKFKSAVEPLMLESMSEENREQTSAYVGSIWNSLLGAIAKSRNLSEEQINTWINGLEIFSAQSVLDKGLVDGLKYLDEVLAELVDKTGAESIEKLSVISLSKYGRSRKVEKQNTSQKIAVIYAEGDIMMGKGSDNIMSESMSKAIRSARLDSTVKAIVFRINSGGGSVLASDIIGREIQLASDVKPVIASFGDVAASGGYYVATHADVIVADPTTITGSIGVFGIIPNIKRLMNTKLGITQETVNTNKFADFGNLMRPLAAEEKVMLQKLVEETYDVFITRVSTGRNISKEAVDEIGQGRVWSAVDAKRIGLVDEFGGVSEAIRIAADKAGLTDYGIEELPKQVGTLEALLSGLTEEVSSRSIRKELGEQYKYYKLLKDVMNMTQGVQARLPYSIELY